MMIIGKARIAAAIAFASLVGVGLAGCSGSGSASGPTASGGTTLIAPIIVDLSSTNGQVVTVALKNVVDLTTGSTTVTDWKGEVADPAIAKFVDGKVEGGATFNPGITPLAVGATTVTVTNSSTGFRTTFDLNVTP